MWEWAFAADVEREALALLSNPAAKSAEVLAVLEHKTGAVIAHAAGGKADRVGYGKPAMKALFDEKKYPWSTTIWRPGCLLRRTLRRRFAFPA